MKKESLIKAIDICLKEIDKSSINVVDKAELLLNLYHFLNESEYENNIKKLQKK